ncbi:MAG: DNA-3-methyladenine glycosylase I [Gammaproteobacteria bacterium]|nr:DNA-3-methyladenine glycosylase I [Gammaproteobacteria bacterium]
MSKKLNRCAWVNQDPLYIAYHDNEWGRPVYDDRLLFEFLILEGAQAGLSWITILKRRDHYRKVFANFDVKKIARFTPEKIEKILLDPGIIRNRLKVESVVINAKAYLKLIQEGVSFSDYLWSFVGGKPINTKRKSIKDMPAKTDISDKLSKDLKRRGFKFIGSTICYAYMQAVGLVNDHTRDCFCAKLS